MTEPEPATQTSKFGEWTALAGIVLRVLLVIVGIPAVWTLRAYGIWHITAWHAALISLVLFLFAIGETVLATLLGTA
ncbi:hypothetical protein [Mycobacteroides abscessus]